MSERLRYVFPLRAAECFHLRSEVTIQWSSVSFSRCTMIFKFSFQVYAILISFWVGGIVKVLEKTVVAEKDGPKL